MLEKIFKLSEKGTDAKREITAGITTFMTMAYILAVNPNILSRTGMDPTAVLLATCIMSFIGTACMGLIANLPLAISSGMGLNAFLTYTVVLGMGYTWQQALLAVFIEGVLFIIMSVTNIREAIFNAIPVALKNAVAIGIGLFIAFIGLQNSGLIVADSSTLVTIVDFTENFSTVGICAVLAIIGTLITAVLYIRKAPGAILIGIIISWVTGIICQLCGIYVPDPANGYNSLIPTLSVTDFSRLKETFGQCFTVDFQTINIADFAVIVVSFLFVDLFDNIGALIGVCAKANFLDENGKLPNIKRALLPDAIATTAGSVLGTSTATVFVESSAGVAAGGKTGLTALTTAVLFLAAMFFAPLFVAIPSYATAPALILVGFLMFTSIPSIKFSEDNYTNAIPAYFCIIAMPLFYSISEGISLGIISYVVINLLCGKSKNITPLMYVLAILFVLKYIFL